MANTKNKEYYKKSTYKIAILDNIFSPNRPKNKKGILMKILYISLVTASLIYAEEINSFPSYQGFRGVINTPNSEVMKEGEFEFLYTNQVEDLTNQHRTSSNSLSSEFRDNKTQKNYYLNIGVLPNLDLNFQYAYGFDDVANLKHLSNRVVNAKYKIPFIPNDLFHVAVGIQDIGGGNPYIGNKYAVISKKFNIFRTSLGYAKGDSTDSIDGIFGSIEYQPLSWLQLAGEYDTKEWNGAIKAQYATKIGEQKVNLGLMAKSSLDYNDVYFGIYVNMPFENRNVPLNKEINSSPTHLKSIENLKLSNISSYVKDDIHYFEYENTLYAHNDIDALGLVLGTLATNTKAKNIVVSIKKANIIQYTIKTNTKEYKEFLETGKFRSNLLSFTEYSNQKQSEHKHSDRFKPTLTLQPDFVLVDGGEYSKVMDYTLALQAELSMRLAKGTILSGRYNIPLTMTDNFDDNGIFDYRNRNKTTAEIDQVLLSQYFQIDLPYRWISLLQVGQFDRKLTGGSFESEVSTLDGKHSLIFKASKLKDDMYKNMDRYYEENRDEQLISYKYYSDILNSNIKLTAGDFLYGDSGSSISLERYFNDTSLRFDLSHTEHRYKGTNTLGIVTLNIPFGTKKRLKTPYIDIQGGDMTYVKRKTIVSEGTNSYALPHHLKEVDNSFTLEKYYLNNNRFHPAYIKSNYNRLRNVFVGN